ncbi:unnamed protein product [Brugia timori]|uniref:Uncharacterized protein n=1 Tax=Brugia timori TaxID=42155 RepID=A0A0R3QX29_9BILA|nr:unnamed protein product [Brugia timori]
MKELSKLNLFGRFILTCRCDLNELNLGKRECNKM